MYSSPLATTPTQPPSTDIWGVQTSMYSEVVLFLPSFRHQSRSSSQTWSCLTVALHSTQTLRGASDKEKKKRRNCRAYPCVLCRHVHKFFPLFFLGYYSSLGTELNSTFCHIIIGRCHEYGCIEEEDQEQQPRRQMTTMMVVENGDVAQLARECLV